MRRIYLFIAIVVFTQWKMLDAQILPPTLDCFRRDSLVWTPSFNNCGPFQSYDIFFSSNRTGPYVLLTSVTNPAQTRFFHANPNRENRFYFMRSRHNCPGVPSLSSDTLDSSPPKIFPIRSVSVVNNQIVVSWEPSATPSVKNYLIYRNSVSGLVLLDTVKNNTTYTDINVDPERNIYEYAVIGLDKCGNSTLFGQNHFSTLMKDSVLRCQQSIRLNWNAYQNWQGGVAKYEIWVREGNGPFSLRGTAASTDTVFTVTGVNNGRDYCYYVKAYQNRTPGDTARSNIRCVKLNVVQQMQDIYSKNATFDVAGNLTYFWQWDTAGDVQEYKIFRGESAGNLPVLSTVTPVSRPLSVNNNFSDLEGLGFKGPRFYKITTKDLCGREVNSTVVSTIYLQSLSAGTAVNQVNWTPFNLENGVVQQYELFRVSDSRITSAGIFPSSTLSFLDTFSVSRGDAEICYFVVSETVLTFPSGRTERIRTRSNTFCTLQPAIIQMPNAFIPTGFSQEFKPVFLFSGDVEYNYRIFNRFGQMVFETNDTNAGWNGRVKDEFAAQDVYVYHIILKQRDGKVSESKGSFLLMR
jgi:gliding motility-associated-like protein